MDKVHRLPSSFGRNPGIHVRSISTLETVTERLQRRLCLLLSSPAILHREQVEFSRSLLNNAITFERYQFDAEPKDAPSEAASQPARIGDLKPIFEEVALSLEVYALYFSIALGTEKTPLVLPG